MQILKAIVKPKENGTYQVRLFGRDDTGRILESWLVAGSLSSLTTLAKAGFKDMETYAAEVSEEETYNASGKE